MKITKSGRLIVRKKNIKSGRFISRDITNSLIFYLDSMIFLEKGANLKSIFNLIYGHIEYLSPLLTASSNWLYELYNEVFDNEFQKCSSIDYLKLYWDVYDLSSLVYKQFSFLGLNNKDNEKYALELTPLYAISELPIIIDNNISFKIGNKSYNYKYDFTLLDILTSIFYELSFFGGTKQKEKSLKELKNRIKNEKNI